MRYISLLLTFLIFALLSCTGPPAVYAYDPMCEFYEEHNGACCSDCHDMVSCATTNLFCVPCPISTPNSGEKPVVYDSINSQVKGEAPYNGVCEVCHTQTRYHRNNASGDHTHCADKRCTSCHLHGPTTMVSKGLCYTCHGGDPGDVPAGNPPMFTTPGVQSHLTHKNAAKGPQFGDVGADPGCAGCHQSSSGGGVFLDGKPFATTSACDNCHSSGGAFDGVQMAKANWDNGTYESDGTALKSGKDKWCASCHDNAPAYSKAQITEPIIIDNPDAEFVGWWPLWIEDPDKCYGVDFRWWITGGDGSCTATWTPDIPSAGNYNVYAIWTSTYDALCPNAPYTINYNGGSQTVWVDQTDNRGEWYLLGTYNFAAGTSGSVVLSDNATGGGRLDADAIKWQRDNTIPGTYAPNVIGDNSTYGYYATGHGANGMVECLDCHDASKTHIDHEHRTYELEFVFPNNWEAVNPYCDSYRLKDINGQPSMTIPRPAADPIMYWRYFALCFECHNRDEVLGEDQYDVSHTNFWDDDGSPRNSHYYHLTVKPFDSDWAGMWPGNGNGADSADSCIACHNVHGPPNQAMIRHGELISTYGTTDKVPALSFGYLVPEDADVATATWPAPVGTYYVYACSAPAGTIAPNGESAWPSATNAKYTVNHSGGSDVFTVNQQTGSFWNQLGTGMYTFGAGGSVVLSNEGADSYVFADAIGFDSDGVLVDNLDGNVALDPEIVVDNPSASYVGTWTNATSCFIPILWEDIHGTDYEFHAKPGPSPVPDPDASLEESMGSWMGRYTGVCGTCHNEGGIPWVRDPYLGPKVLSPKADPKNIAAQEASQVLLTARVLHPYSNLDSVIIDLSAIGGGIEPMVHQGDGIYSYQATVPESDIGYLSFLVTATDQGGLTAENTIIITVGVFEIVDNSQGTFAEYGNWPASSTVPGYYDTNYQYHDPGSGDDYFHWTPTITTAGTYKVFARWVEDPNYAPDATYTIYHDGGSTPVSVNQRSNGGQWVSLGTYSFDGTDDYVELGESPNGSVCADAIKWEPQP